MPVVVFLSHSGCQGNGGQSSFPFIHSLFHIQCFIAGQMYHGPAPNALQYFRYIGGLSTVGDSGHSDRH